jgi:hypothetical protein
MTVDTYPTVRRRFPSHAAGAQPGFVNGGVVAGTLAEALGASPSQAVAVRLQRPVPLATHLTLESDGQTLCLVDGKQYLATASASPETLHACAPVSVEQVAAAVEVVPLDCHPAPGCFVCGPANRDGLNLQPGAVGNSGVVATLWCPPPRFVTDTGELPPPLVWAALDCPSWYGAAQGRPALLGTITAQQLEPIVADQPVIVTGWPHASEGRKTLAGSAIHTPDGELLAVASTIWIHPKELRS